MINKHSSQVSHKVTQERNRLTTYRNNLSLLPDLTKMDIGAQSGNIESTVAAYARLTKDSAQLTVDSPSSLSLRIARLANNRKSEQKPDIVYFNRLSRETINTTSISLTTLQKLLEYNPALDFEEFDPEDGDTKDRIVSAQAAVSNMRGTLDGNQKQLDGNVYKSLVSELEKLQLAADKLAISHDIDGWKRQTAASQKAIVTTLSDYFTGNRRLLLHQSIAINSHLSFYQ